MKTQKSIIIHIGLVVLLVCSLITPIEFCLAQTISSETYPVKLDEYGDLRTDDEAAHLDLFAEKLFKQPKLRGYVVAYDEPLMEHRGSYLRRIYGVGRYLTEARGIEANRVVVIDGGYKEKFTTELWLVPEGANPPTPAPSMSQPAVNTSVAFKFDVECLNCSAAVNLYRDGLDEQGLKFYAEALRTNPDSRALMVARPDGNISVRYALKEARRAKRLLVKNLGIDASRIIIKSGRSRNDRVAVVEMWIVPRGAKYSMATSNNSFNRSANSVAFIENLNLSVLCARPVNSGVRCLCVMEIRNIEGQVIFFCEGDLKQADLDDADLSGAMLEKADLSPVVWCDTNLSGANLKDADLYWAFLFGSNLSDANLEGADLRGAYLKDVNLSRANLVNADCGFDMLGGSTKLQGANLTGAQIQGARFDGAQYDNQTIFPDSFDPVEHGMIFRVID